MKQSNKSRRQFVKHTAAGLGLLSIPDILLAQPLEKAAKKKIVCVGGHPDDPESGCGGTLAKLAAAGHSVTVIYLTTGEAGIEGKSHDEAATIRKQEAINACKILHAKPVFAGQTDGDTIVNSEWIERMQQLVTAEEPDIVFTHWPIDSHKDHQAASLLTIQTWLRSKQRFTLYFFEVSAGEQTMVFHPTGFIDISDTQEQKRRAVYCHASQDPAGIYNSGHSAMEEFRGKEIGAKAAEAFVIMNGKGQGDMMIW